MSDAEAVIETRDLHFSYGSIPILSDIRLRVAQGEFLGIVGPNAGGKSTLLKLILGLLQPRRGHIQVLGKPPAQVARWLGYVPQYPGFPRDFPITVEQVVALGRIGGGPGNRLRRLLPEWGAARRAARAAVQAALAEVEADAIAKRRIGALSGGQLQRVLLARALVGQPRILILDEPTANIDHRLEGEIFDLLRELNRRMTILVVSHDVAFISQYVNRVACLNRSLVCHATDAIDGRVIQDLYGGQVRMIHHHHGH